MAKQSTTTRKQPRSKSGGQQPADSGKARNGRDVSSYEQELSEYLQERIKPGLNRGAIPLLARSIAKELAHRAPPEVAGEDEADNASTDDFDDETEAAAEEGSDGETEAEAAAEDDPDEGTEAEATAEDDPDEETEAETDDDFDEETEAEATAEEDSDEETEAETDDDFDDESEAEAEADDDFDDEDEDETEAEADDDFDEPDDDQAADGDNPPDFEADMHDLQAELGEDWILRFSVHGGDTWLTAEKEDGSQHVEAPTASVLAEVVDVLNENGGRSS